MIVVIANRYGENPFGLLLLDHEAIEIISNLLGFAIETANRFKPFVTEGSAGDSDPEPEACSSSSPGS